MWANGVLALQPSSGRLDLTTQERLQDAILSSLEVNLAILDKKGFIVHVSESWIRFAEENGAPHGWTGVGVNYLDVCRCSLATCSDAQHALEGILSVMNGAVPRFQYQYRCDSMSEPRWFVMTVTPLAQVASGVIVLHQNDTEMKKAEIRYGELLDSVRAIVWRAQAPGFRTTFASKQVTEILGYPAEAWTKDPDLWRKHIHPDDREWVLAYGAKAVRERRDHSFEYRMIAADGRIVWLRNIVNVIVENDRPRELVGISIDITERKQAEEERAQLTDRLFRAQEDERSSIARELHDDLGQSLALLGIKLEKLEQQLGLSSNGRGQIADLYTLTEQMTDDVHRLSHGLHPSSLELLGLADAVKQQCRDFAEHNDATLEFKVGDIPRDLDKHSAACLLRVLQECLHNIAKHSQARNVAISLSAGPGEIRLQIRDDGVGFDPAAKTVRQGLGLASMSERLRLARGKFSVTSAPGAGTQIDATIPLRQTE